MLDINVLLSSNDKFVVKIAKMALSAREYFDAGKLSEEEYNNISEKIQSMYEIEKQASSIERKKLLDDAIKVIKSILSVFPV